MKKNIISIFVLLTVLFSVFSVSVNAEIKTVPLFNRDSINLYPKQTYRLFITNFESALFTSSDNNIATIDGEGTVTAVKAGTSIITAKTSDGHTTQCTVNVSNGVSPEEILLTTQSLSLTKGTGKKLEATVYPENVSDKSVYYSSSDTSVATVDKKGYVKGINPGVAVITAESSSSAVTKKCIVKVSSLSTEKDSVVSVNGTVYSISGKKYENMTVEIKNSKESKRVTSNKNGQFKIENVEPGIYTMLVFKNDEKSDLSASASITVLNYNMNVSCIVNNNELVILYQDQLSSSQKVKDITLEKSSLILDSGEEYDMTYTVRPSNIEVPSLICLSSNEKIAEVDSDGRIKAVSEGKATITFSTVDGRIKKSCIVTVTNVNSNKYSWLVILVEASVALVIVLTFLYSYKKFIRHKENIEMEENKKD